MSVAGTDLNLLVPLQALLEEGNLTRAGQRIGMTQPAMSAALGKLRRRYGDELLVKVGRDFELTPLARALLPQIQQTMPLVERAFGLDRRFEPVRSTRHFTIAASDYAMVLLAPELRRRLDGLRAGVAIDWRPLPPDLISQPRGLLDTDLVIAPRGLGVDAPSADLFADRFVLVVDPANPAYVDGAISDDSLRRLGWARAALGADHLNPADRRLAQLGIDHHSGVTARGWLPLPFLVRGTELVAILPERLARRTASLAGVVIVPTPFREATLPEALWWHPSREHDPGLVWLRSMLVEVASTLAGPTG
ncbi:MAG: LysR family transcriptional regulator [Nocardioides sp.]|uniref:LysR family transcriptional regulator n=1 Tax=Nocardioides sp. TaxID=35761 RepID=UPI0039E2E7CF